MCALFQQNLLQGEEIFIGIEDEIILFRKNYLGTIKGRERK